MPQNLILDAQDVLSHLRLEVNGTLVPYRQADETFAFSTPDKYPTAIAVAGAPGSYVLNLTQNDGSVLGVVLPPDVEVQSLVFDAPTGIVTLVETNGQQHFIDITAIFTCAKVMNCFGTQTGICIAFNPTTQKIDFKVEVQVVP